MDDGRWECDDLPQLVEEASTASMEDLPTEAQQSVSEACQEAGIDLRVMRDGYRHVTPEPLLDPKADAELLAELAELERMLKGIGGFEDVQGEHCNQQHIDGCPNRFKQHDNRHAREGKTKPMKKKTISANEMEEKKPTFFEFRKMTKSEEEARNHLTGISEKTLFVRENHREGILGRGAKAPGEGQPEFFLTKNSIGELVCLKNRKKSADKESHLTAAAHVCELWRHSAPIGKGRHRDTKEDYTKSPIEWMHRRVAYIRIGKKKYEVKLTAKEFKKERPHVLYCVQTRLIK